MEKLFQKSSNDSLGKEKRGFNLIELMVAVSIIAILTAIIIPRVDIAQKKVREKSIKTQLASLEANATIFYAENNGVFDDDDGTEDGICQTEYFKEALKQVESNLGAGGTVSCIDDEQNWYVVTDLVLDTDEKACVGAGASFTSGAGITGANCSATHQQSGVSGGGSIPPVTLLNPQSANIFTNSIVNFTTTSSSDEWTFKCHEGATLLTGTGVPSLPSCTYNTAGSFTAILTLTDTTTGLSGIDTTIVTVNQPNNPPTAILTPPSVAVDTGVVAHFDGSASSDPDPGDSITGWSLDCDNGVVREGAGVPPNNINCSYSSAGSYTPMLTVTDSNGASNTSNSSVAANAPPTITINPDTASVATNTDKEFTVTPSDSDGSISYWNYKCNDADAWSTNQTLPTNNFSCNWSSSGNKTVTARATDDDSSTSSATSAVTANNQDPTIGITPSVVTVSVGTSQEFTVTPEDLDGNDTISHWNYKCNNADAWSADQTLPTDNFSCTWMTNGSKTVSVQVEDDNGATGNNSANVTVNL